MVQNPLSDSKTTQIVSCLQIITIAAVTVTATATAITIAVTTATTAAALAVTFEIAIIIAATRSLGKALVEVALKSKRWALIPT